MRRLGRLGTVVLAAVVLVGAGSIPIASSAPVGFSPTPVAGWSTNGIVKAVLVVGDTVYAGGTFTQVQSSDLTQTLPRANLAAFDIRTGAIRSAFSADTDGRVLSLASDGAHLFVGGDYATISGKNRSRLASIDLATGAVNNEFTGGATSNVYALRVSGTRLYVGGSFGTLNGVARGRIGAVDTTTGAVDPNFNPGADDAVHSIVASPDGATVYVGGDFTNIGAAPRLYLAAVTAATGAATGVTFEYPLLPGPEAPWVEDVDISPSGDRVFAALAGDENQAASWSTATGQKQWSYVVDGDTQAVRYYQGNVYFGFHQGAIGDDTVRLLSVDAATGALNDFRPSVNSFFGTWDIDVSPTYNTLVVGGEFTNVNGVNTQGVALLPPVSSDTEPPTTPGVPMVTASSGTSLTLSWAPGTDNQGVAGYLVLRNGLEVGHPSATTFTDTPLNPSTDYTYTIQTVDVAANLSPPSAPIVGHTGVVLLPAGSTWRYLDTGTNQGTAWRAGGFDDSTWKTGAAELGYGDGDEATVVSYGPDANNKYPTTYFRQQFNVANPAVLGALTLRLVRDDGAVVYLNGTEVVRSNMPNGTITSSTYAVDDIGGTDESTWNVSNVSSGLIVPGTNTIAVEIHQQSAGSSDISFNLALEAASTQGPAPTNLHTTAVTGTSASLAWTAPSGSVTSYNVYRNGTLVGTSPAPSFTDSGLTSAQSYSFTVTAVGSSGESPASAPLPVTTPDGTPPSVPQNLRTTSRTTTQINLAWDASTDDTGVASYIVTRNGVDLPATTHTTLNDAGLSPGTTYTYTVRATDAALNSSAPSTALTTATKQAALCAGVDRQCGDRRGSVRVELGAAHRVALRAVDGTGVCALCDRGRNRDRGIGLPREVRDHHLRTRHHVGRGVVHGER